MCEFASLPDFDKPTECSRRISVVGTTGSGKTVLARQISRRLSILHVELDALYGGPDWTQAPLEVFRERVENFSTQFFTRDSLFLWALRTYPRRRREYPFLFQTSEHAHLSVVCLCSPRAAREWLESLR